MARREQYVVGLDVGTSTVICVVGEAFEDWAGDARYFEYSKAANPIGSGHTPRVPVIQFGPEPAYIAQDDETVSLKFLPNATRMRTSLDPERDTVAFVVQKEEASQFSSEGERVIISAASNTVATAGALSMGAATQAGKVQAIMDVMRCPNLNIAAKQKA